jgi:hypothetical protein
LEPWQASCPKGRDSGGASAASERVQKPCLYPKLFAVSTEFLIANTMFTQKEYFLRELAYGTLIILLILNVFNSRTMPGSGVWWHAPSLKKHEQIRIEYHYCPVISPTAATGWDYWYFRY